MRVRLLAPFFHLKEGDEPDLKDETARGLIERGRANAIVALDSETRE